MLLLCGNSTVIGHCFPRTGSVLIAGLPDMKEKRPETMNVVLHVKTGKLKYIKYLFR